MQEPALCAPRPAIRDDGVPNPLDKRSPRKLNEKMDWA